MKKASLLWAATAALAVGLVAAAPKTKAKTPKRARIQSPKLISKKPGANGSYAVRQFPTKPQ